MQWDLPSIRGAELRSSLGEILVSHPLWCDWLRSKRWFMDKDAEIHQIAFKDRFLVDLNDDTWVCGVILVLFLQYESGIKYQKRYFMPLLISCKLLSGIDKESVIELAMMDGDQYVHLAEHSSLFQRFFLKALQSGNSIITESNNNVSFLMYGSRLEAVDISKVVAKPLAVSTSNVLTQVSTNVGELIVKSYKDMRGEAEAPGRRWPPNMEMVRYEALAAAGYRNMPQLHGVCCYRDQATGASVPLMLLMEKIESHADAGEVFGTALSQLIHAGNQIDLGRRALNRKATSRVSRLLAGTASDFHHAFLQSGKPGFEAVQVSDSDLGRWCTTARNRYERGIRSLEQRSGRRPGDVALRDLVGRLRALSPFELPEHLFKLSGRLKKAQVHGDLSTAQGLIDWTGSGNPIACLFEHVASGREGEALKAAESLARRVRWMDFEGEPAKEGVDQDYDARQNLLVDVAGALQGFWYLGNIGLYTLLGLYPAENAAHREPARKASLALAGQVAVEEAGVDGLTPEMLATIHEWSAAVSEGFVRGYLDQVEENHMEEAILADWDRGLARSIVDFWVVFRALHELCYETYGRDSGWEAIPAGRILQLTPHVDLASHAEA